MSKLNDLIKELCPSGVEYKTLGDIGEVRMCKRILKEQTTDVGEIPFYKIGTFGKQPNAYISRQLFQEYKTKYSYPNIGDILISASGTIGRTVIFDGEDAYFQDSNIVWIENDETKALNKYLFYFYQIAKWGIAEGGTIQRLYNENLKKAVIPLPPLPVQEEIVRILDTFTELTAELTAELEARKKQYEYYMDSLLSFGDEVEHFSLRECIGFLNGKGHEKSIVDAGKYIVVNSKFISSNGSVLKYSDVQLSPVFKADILMVMSDLPNGKALAKCFFVDSNNKYTLNQRICALSLKPAIDDCDGTKKKFLYYFLNRNRQLLKFDNGADQTNLRKDDILNIKIPDLNKVNTKRLVDILDRFDTLCNDISSGLPAEIKARQQQYEYYRNQLLDFDKLRMEN